MTGDQRSISSTTKPFVFGLAIGLVVGGLAGAFIGGLMETSIPSVKSPPARPKAGTPARDERPAATGATETPAPESAASGAQTPPSPSVPAATQPAPK